MSRRGRKRARAAQAGVAADPALRAGEPELVAEPEPRLSRSEQKNAEARAKLVPLKPGERPVPVTIAAVVALVLTISNVVLALSGYKIGGDKTALPGVLIFSGLLLVMAWGLWRARYWAVLGMQALLGLTMLAFGLALPFASNVKAVVVSLGVLLPSATLFWFLVKAMARIQMPDRPGER